jgi:hypothetical protein
VAEEATVTAAANLKPEMAEQKVADGWQEFRMVAWLSDRLLVEHGFDTVVGPTELETPPRSKRWVGKPCASGSRVGPRGATGCHTFRPAATGDGRGGQVQTVANLKLEPRPWHKRAAKARDLDSEDMEKSQHEPFKLEGLRAQVYAMLKGGTPQVTRHCTLGKLCRYGHQWK